MPLYKDAEKLWKVQVIAARQADSSLIHVRVNLKGETPAKFQRQYSREENKLMKCCIVVPRHLVPQHTFSHILCENEEIATYLRAD